MFQVAIATTTQQAHIPSNPLPAGWHTHFKTKALCFASNVQHKMPLPIISMANTTVPLAVTGDAFCSLGHTHALYRW